MIVIDASVATKWLVTEKEIYHTEAMHLLSQHLDKLNSILVPELIFYEVANTLATKTAIPSSVALKSIRNLYKLNLQVYHPIQEDVSQATKLAKKYQVTVYDMLYAVIAQKHNCPLITTDDRFIAKTNFPFVTHLKNIPLTTSPV